MVVQKGNKARSPGAAQPNNASRTLSVSHWPINLAWGSGGWAPNCPARESRPHVGGDVGRSASSKLPHWGQGPIRKTPGPGNGKTTGPAGAGEWISTKGSFNAAAASDGRPRSAAGEIVSPNAVRYPPRSSALGANVTPSRSGRLPRSCGYPRSLTSGLRRKREAKPSLEMSRPLQC